MRTDEELKRGLPVFPSAGEKLRESTYQIDK
jgi:hypothetical protein